MNLKLVARRLVWGKFFNGGQTCIAPDYVLIKQPIKAKLIAALKAEIIKRYGNNPKTSPDFSRIIDTKNTNRLAALLQDTPVVYGGDIDITNCYISPTIVDAPALDSPLMREEIFGPILPVLTYETEKDIEDIIGQQDTPLALYIFSNQEAFIEKTINKYRFGGGVVNDVLIHFGNHRLPFGGIGTSGMGNYHGKHGFDTFSHDKSMMKRGNWTDPSFRYPPYKGKMHLLKKVFKWFG